MKLSQALDQAQSPHSAINKSGKHAVAVYETTAGNKPPSYTISTEPNSQMYVGHSLDDILDFLRRPINSPPTDDLDLDAWEPI